MKDSLIFDNVHRRFGNEEVLRGLSFRVKPGTIYALLGRNGAGKTTALRILLGFLEPMRGSTAILGKDSRNLPPDLRGRIGYISEGHRLYATMRVSDAIRFEAGTRPRFSSAYAEKAVARCGIRRGKHIGLLSRGQRAQLSLIFAVAGEPEVLIFDDPAMGLDVVMRREFLDAMIDLLGDRGCGVLFSSHILTDVERIADRVGILHGGRLIVDATLADLKRRVCRRRWSPRGDMAPAPAERDWILRRRTMRDGIDLTLLDMNDEREKELRAAGDLVGDPAVPTLEDLFLDLTTDGEEIGTLAAAREEIS